MVKLVGRAVHFSFGREKIFPLGGAVSTSFSLITSLELKLYIVGDT